MKELGTKNRTLWLSGNSCQIFLWPDTCQFFLVSTDRKPGLGYTFVHDDYFCFIVTVKSTQLLGLLTPFSLLRCLVVSTGLRLMEPRNLAIPEENSQGLDEGY